MRLQRFIAMHTSYSRRKAEELILKGKINVNGKPFDKLGINIDPKKDKVKLNGKLISPGKNFKYILLNKPSGYLSTCRDTHNRKTVLDLIPYKNLYPVGRLDKNTEGLLLLTDDGDFAYKIMHPKFEKEKEYTIKFKNKLTNEKIRKLEKGILIDKKMTSPCKITKIRKANSYYSCHLIIHEGRKRQIRRMFEEIGCPVIYLKRIRIGGLKLASLKKGKFRELTKKEIESLLK